MSELEKRSDKNSEHQEEQERPGCGQVFLECILVFVVISIFLAIGGGDGDSTVSPRNGAAIRGVIYIICTAGWGTLRMTVLH